MAVKTYGSVGNTRKELVKIYASVNNTRKELKKVYGSVNNQRKLIHTSTPPVPPAVSYGTVYYKTNLSDLDTKSIDLDSVAEFESLCIDDPDMESWTATVGSGSVTVSNDSTNIIIGVTIGASITSIPRGFLYMCNALSMPIEVPSNVTSIGMDFLSDCSNFNQAVTLSSGLTSIGVGFLGFCTSFNQPLSLPGTLTSIDRNFLHGCTSFNQPLTLPGSLTSIGIYFLNNCNNMTSTVNVGALSSSIALTSNYSFATSSSSALCYTTGITIAGDNRSAWLTSFPDRSGNPYRKLLDAGY